MFDYSIVGTSVWLFLQLLDFAIDSVICLLYDCFCSIELQLHVDIFTIRSIVVDAA